MMTGEPHAISLQVSLRQRQSCALRWVAQIRRRDSSIPNGVANVIDRAVVFSAKDRYQRNGVS